MKVRVDHDPMRRAFRLSVRIGDQYLAQEVDEMAIAHVSDPSSFIDEMTEQMMRKAEAMQYRQEQAMMQQAQQIASQYPNYYPGGVVYRNAGYGITSGGAGNSGGVQMQNPFLQCVGQGWQVATGPVKQVFRNAIKFFRVNEEVEMEEGADWGEPLDELRLKVKRWLKK